MNSARHCDVELLSNSILIPTDISKYDSIFGNGLFEVLGIPAGMGWLWAQVFAAGSWYAGLGWFIVALLALGAVLWGLGWLVVKLWQAVDGVAMYMDKRRE